MRSVRRHMSRIVLRRSLLSIGSVVLPTLILTVYLLLSRSGERPFTAIGDWSTLGVAICAGVACIWFVPDRWYWRVIASTVLATTMSFALAFYSLIFVCGVFGDCP